MKCVRSVSISWTNDDVVHIDTHKTSIVINSVVVVGGAPDDGERSSPEIGSSILEEPEVPIYDLDWRSMNAGVSRYRGPTGENRCRRGVDPHPDGRERTPIISRAADNWKRTDPNVRPTGRATKINESRHS